MWEKNSPSIFWRSKLGHFPPEGAQFSLYPFRGEKINLSSHALVTALPTPSSPIRVLKRIDTPDKQGWEELVKKALVSPLKKVVLARETTLYLDHAPDPFAITAALRSVGAALFCATLGNNKAFLGATPERLFSLKEGQLLVEAVAGTRKRGDALARELLASEKDNREFQFVQDYFQTLIPSCQFSPRQIHQTANVQHLFSQGTALLEPCPPAHELINLFHPTPALAGTPKQAALDWILAEEPFIRGPYGGVIGWEKGEQSEWMVAIRCCLLEGNIAKLYTGTGIVQGSDPSLEWEELEAKLSLYAPLFEGLS